MAINRSATQVASIAIIAFLGFVDTGILAAFGLALSYASIFFVLATSVQMGIQAEFSRCFAMKDYSKLWKTFSGCLLLSLVVSVFLSILILLLPNPFGNAESEILGISAYQTVQILSISLLPVGILTTITLFLESVGHIGLVAKLRIAQVWLQLACVVLAVLVPAWTEVSSQTQAAAVAYIVSDIIVLLTSIVLLRRVIQVNALYPATIIIQIRFRELIEFARIGFPLTLGMTAQKALFFSCSRYLSGLGMIETAAFSLVNSLIFLLQIPLMGAAHLLTLEVSAGRGNANSMFIRKAFMMTLLIVIVELILTGAIFIFCSEYLLAFFTNDGFLTEFIKSNSWSVLLFFAMNAMLLVAMSALRGFGDNAFAQSVLLLALGSTLLPAMYADYWHPSFSELLVTFSISGLIAAFLLLVRFRFKTALVGSAAKLSDRPEPSVVA